MAEVAPAMAVDAAEIADVTPVRIGFGMGKMVIVWPPLTRVEMAEAVPAAADETPEIGEPG